jgi:hypothetical protein
MSRQLGGGEALASGSPCVVPEPDLRAKFEYAMRAITQQDWRGFAAQCVTTVGNQPGEFGQAILVGIYDYLKSEVEGYVELGSSIVRWIGNARACVADVGTGILNPDEVLGSQAYQPFHGAARTLLAVHETLQDLAALGFAGVLKLVSELLSLAGVCWLRCSRHSHPVPSRSTARQSDWRLSC